MNAERMLIMFGRASAEPIYSRSKPIKAGFLLTLYMPLVTMEVFWVSSTPARQLSRMEVIASIKKIAPLPVSAIPIHRTLTGKVRESMKREKNTLAY